jgi:flagellar biosynthesis protein FlhA
MNKKKSFTVFFISTTFVTVALINIGGILYNIYDTILGKNTDDIWLITLYFILSLISIITGKGTVRITEVITRFSLDSLPFKRMAIDTDLENKTIDFNEANNKKIELSKKIDFWDQINDIARIMEKANKAIIILQFGIVLILEICYRIFNIKIEIKYINNILKCGLITECIFLLIFSAAGYLVTKYTKNNNI